VGHTDSVNGVAITSDGSYLVSASLDSTLKVWDLATGALLRTLEGHTRALYGVAVMPDGRRAVSASHDFTLKVWDLATAVVIATFTADAEMSSCAVSPDGTAIIAGDTVGRLHFLRLENA
jgi:WD40 repeat protein